MMLAQAEKVDVLHEHHLLVLFLEDGLVNQFMGVFFIPFREVFPGAGHAFGRTLQALAVGILADFQK